MNLAPNLYLNRTAIKEERHFFGRTRELATIFSRIDAAAPQSVSIVGDRRIGKSSLLRALQRKRASLLTRPDEFVFVYLDLQEQMHGDVASFFSILLEEIALARQDPALAEQPPTYETVRRLVATLGRARTKTVLLLDEFEAITQNRNFSIEFFSFLRSLPNNYPVSFIVTSARELQKLCHSQEIAGSPFFNIFHKLNLGCFSPKESLELICRPSAAADYPLEAHAKFIFQLAGYIPFFLQIACCAFFEARDEDPESVKPHFDLIRQKFFEEAVNHFEYVWAHFGKRERSLCIKISERQSLSEADKSFVGDLVRRGYVCQDAVGSRLFSEVFEEFVQHRVGSRTKPASPPPSVTQDLTASSVGRFAVRARLGSGGMGEVYLAEDTTLKRLVALKRIAPAFRNDPEYRLRFTKEAQRASQLSDPRIAAIYDIIEEKGELFLVMEYVEGRTLRQYSAESPDLDSLLKIVEQCAEALVVAHGRGIIHCDIKPENVLLTAGGKVKVLDFGVARIVPQRNEHAATPALEPTVIRFFEGSPGYSAPEMLLRGHADSRSDIFSFGVVCYEMLAGFHPFLSPTWMQTADRVLHETPPSLVSLNASIPHELDHIVRRCLEKSPESRYQESGELLAAFARIRAQTESQKSPRARTPVVPADLEKP